MLSFFAIYNETGIIILSLNETRCDRKTSIETMTKNLFIEQWSTESSFSAYYKECAPVACTYRFPQRNSFLYVLTTLLGLYGGLTVVLRICVPRAIDWWRKRSLPPTDVGPRKRCHFRKNAITIFFFFIAICLIKRLTEALQQVRDKLMQLDLFRISTTDTDPFDQSTSIISTRIYLSLLCLSIAILSIFTRLKNPTQIVAVHNPSQAIYENLYGSYSTTLQCPCSEIVIPYGSFLSFTPVYHPICSSLYVTIQWINSVVGTVNHDFSYSFIDFHLVGEAFFNAVTSLCVLSQSTISDQLYFFNRSTLITNHLLNYKELLVRTNIIFDQFESHTFG